MRELWVVEYRFSQDSAWKPNDELVYTDELCARAEVTTALIEDPHVMWRVVRYVPAEEASDEALAAEGAGGEA
jgi:hypothetical protein